jgi:flavin reductase (DIM6/NTAB) family NADH-FMN oxidoreductase RutF
MKRMSTEKAHSMCVQPSFLIGTFNEDGTPNFCPITWASVTSGEDYMFVISMNGKKKTKENIAREGVFTANLVGTDMLDLFDYFGSCSGLTAVKDKMVYAWQPAVKVNAPTLDASRLVYECAVSYSANNKDTATYFAPIKNFQIMEELVDEVNATSFDKLDLQKLQPVIYSGKYYSIGEYLGEYGKRP